MSELTNRASGAGPGAGAYIRAVLELLGDREPLAVLSRLGDEIERRLQGLSREQLGRPEAPGKWSIAGVVQHLADSEVAWAWRLRLVISQERPTLTGFDQDAWAERMHYGEARADEALELLRVLRASNLRLLAALPAEDLERVAVHAERGEETIAHMMRLNAGHDLAHLRQIDRIRAGLDGGEGEGE